MQPNNRQSAPPTKPPLGSAFINEPFNSNRDPRRRLQPRLHLLMLNDPSLLPNYLPTRQNHKVRNPANLKSPRQSRIRLRIHLQHHCFPRHLRRCPRHLRRRHPARPAPVRPKVHQHRHLRVPYDLVKQAFIHRQGLSHRRQLNLARPTAAGTSQMPTAHPVLLSTSPANSNHAHK
jgi:hypothetical protein